METTIPPSGIPSGIVITIGRQFGSGGRELGKRLADSFGIRYYDKELLSEAAEKAGINPRFFEKNDERFPSFVSGVFAFAHGFSSVNPFSGPSSISDECVYKAQSDFIHQKASEESCVFVGRSADYVLRDHPRCLNLFVHAPIEECVKRIMRRGDFGDSDKARSHANKVNRQRADYYNFYTDKTWGVASSYDLSFDTSLIPMEGIVEIVRRYLWLRFGN
ncbi:MAG: cytidylate kinase-like family protein [Paramuribaculum sp.]|nr:cytidylate kinase-like family protein [Paramuribaculum sp.]